MKRLKTISFIILLVLSLNCCWAQLQEFATLKGSPDIDFYGWNLLGDAIDGSIAGGDLRPEIILVDDRDLYRAGGIFYEKAFDANACGQWSAEFDFRIYDGSGADGLSFCFLREIPDELGTGINAGLPYRPNGFAVILDTYNNRVDNDYTTSPPQFCGGENPELQIFYGDGSEVYDECNDNFQRVFDVQELRSPNYNTVLVNYKNGHLEVYLNNELLLEGEYNLDYTGYFGFTACTGGKTDNHSIKNVSIKAKLPQVIADAGLDKVICEGESVQLGGSGQYPDNYSIQWTPALPNGNSNLPNPVVYPVSNGSHSADYLYTLQIGDGDNQCYSYDQVKVTVNPLPVADAGPDKEICIGQEVSLGVNAGTSGGFPPYNFSWLLNGEQISSGREIIQVVPEYTAEYHFEVLDNNGCSGKDSMTVHVIPVPLPVVSLNEPFELCEGETAGLATEFDNAYYYHWNTGESDNQIEIHKPGLYWVDVTPDGGCTIRDSVYIFHCKPNIQAVNLFTPDGDGFNDIFQIKAQDYSEFSLNVYNRWGTRVFSSDNPEVSWNGNGYSEGVYYWNVRVKGFDYYSFWKNYKGIITLLRGNEQQ